MPVGLNFFNRRNLSNVFAGEVAAAFTVATRAVFRVNFSTARGFCWINFIRPARRRVRRRLQHRRARLGAAGLSQGMGGASADGSMGEPGGHSGGGPGGSGGGSDKGPGAKVSLHLSF